MPTLFAASCSRADVAAKIAEASDDDTVVIPACPSGVTWTSRLDFAKAITLKGAGCTYDVKNRPTSCQTVIKNGNASQTGLIEATLVANKTTRITQIEFQNDSGPGTLIGFVGLIGGGAQDNRRYRLDHNRFVQINGLSAALYSAYGLIDHNYLDLITIGLYFYLPSDFAYADARWSEDLNTGAGTSRTGWGSANFSFVEDNYMTTQGAPNMPLTDAYAGARFVTRFNEINKGSVQNHGTESSGRARGGRAMEVYLNEFTADDYNSNIILHRSGTALDWGNEASGYTGGANIANLVNYRSEGPNTAFNIADGVNPWDVNSDSNPFETHDTSAPSTYDPVNLRHTVTVSPSPGWTTDEWRGYTIHKTGCIPRSMNEPCGLLIVSNTADTITYATANYGVHLDFGTGEEFTINRIDHVLDGPARSGGTLLEIRFLTSMTRSGSIVTANLTSHGYSVNDYIGVHENPQVAFNGTWRVSEVVNANQFKFEMGTPVAWSSSYNYSVGDVVTYGGESYYSVGGGYYGNTNQQPDISPSYWAVLSPSTAMCVKVPAGWNDQVTDPAYQWLNTKEAGANLVFGVEPYQWQIRANEQYYDYEPSKTFDGTIASNRSSIGVGTSLPGTCTTGVGYWKTDEGSWNAGSNDFYTGQGRFYRCTATNTWTLYYTPYQYPHPSSTIEGEGGGGGGSPVAGSGARLALILK